MRCPLYVLKKYLKKRAESGGHILIKKIETGF